MVDLENILKEKISKLDKQIKQAAIERDESATPMESASDQTRQIANQLYNSLLNERRALQEKQRLVKKYNKIYFLNNDSEITKYMVVPEGLGGIWVNEILLLAETTPLAEKILSTKIDSYFELNGKKYNLERIEDNN